MSKHKILLVFPLLILFLFSCQKEEVPREAPPLMQEVEYAVGLKTDGLETKGLFCYRSDGSFTFVIQDENSPLNGLKETVTKDKIITEYRGIRWESDEVETTLAGICSILSDFENASLIGAEKESHRGLDATRFTYAMGTDQLLIWKRTDDQTTLTIRCDTGSSPFELNFDTP